MASDLKFSSFEDSLTSVTRAFEGEAKLTQLKAAAETVKNVATTALTSLDHVDKHFQKIERDSRAINEAEAMNNFQFNIAVKRREAAAHNNPDEIFRAYAETEIAGNLRKYGNTTPEFVQKLKNVAASQRLRLFEEAASMRTQITQKQGHDAMVAIAAASIGVPQVDVENNIKKVQEATNYSSGALSEIDAANARNFAKFRRQTVEKGLSLADNSLEPVISSPIAGLSLTGSASYDQLVLLSKDPLLARAFDRIRTLNNFQAGRLVAVLGENFPNSPETQATRKAIAIRTAALQDDPIGFAQKQNLIATESLRFEDPFFSENAIGRRMDDAEKLNLIYGTSGIMTKSEITELSHADDTTKVLFFKALTTKFKTYNLTKPIEARLPEAYLDEDLNAVDPEAASWVKLTTAMPELQKYPLGQIRLVMKSENYRKWIEKKDIFNLTDSDSRAVSGIAGFSNMMTQFGVTSFLSGGSGGNVDDLVEIKDNYVIPKSLSDSVSGFDLRELANLRAGNKNNTYQLRNIGLSDYILVDPNGAPVTLNSKIRLNDRGVIDPKGKYVLDKQVYARYSINDLLAYASELEKVKNDR